MFEISVEELPRPQLKSNSREVFTSPPKFKNDLFRLLAIFRIFSRRLATIESEVSFIFISGTIKVASNHKEF